VFFNNNHKELLMPKTKKFLPKIEKEPGCTENSPITNTHRKIYNQLIKTPSYEGKCIDVMDTYWGSIISSGSLADSIKSQTEAYMEGVCAPPDSSMFKELARREEKLTDVLNEVTACLKKNG
jgi:hypothetical protein